MRGRLIEFVPGLLAGVAGGVAGYLLVAVLMNQGFWMPILPGAFAGLACGQCSPVRSKVRGALIAAITLGLVIYAQWKLFVPGFEFDGSLRDYTLHLHQLPPLTLIIMAVNVASAYWWGREQGIQFARRARP